MKTKIVVLNEIDNKLQYLINLLYDEDMENLCIEFAETLGIMNGTQEYEMILNLLERVQLDVRKAVATNENTSNL